jgi:hypothetical protein
MKNIDSASPLTTPLRNILEPHFYHIKAMVGLNLVLNNIY